MIDWVSIVRHSRRRFSDYMFTVPTKIRKRRRVKRHTNSTLSSPNDRDTNNTISRSKNDRSICECYWTHVSSNAKLMAHACAKLEMFATYVFIPEDTHPAGSMNAVLLRLVTVGKQTFHVTECYNHTGKLKDHYSLNHPQKSLLHPLIDGRDYARSSRDSPEGRAVSLRSVTCNIHDDAPTQSNHYQHDETPVSAALAMITMHSSASKCSTRGRRNPRKDSSGIVSGLRMRPLGGGCSFREVAVWFAPPVAVQSAVLTRTYVCSSLHMYCNTEHEYTGSDRYIHY
ncbi:hypothetical protein ALC53_14254 [Atta colombica]|uniref:Uncharacterized protein n=1 Tax=Atta colombica TaxID=520822 RepID=A0A195AT24_9HYME|nr:hypothetical protein ALC53_14254 [Atta colombica]